MKPIEIHEVSKRIVHLVYATQEDLCLSFVRIQEYYESPEFAGKIFTLGQYRRWYAENNGGWTYPKDWEGFNIPSKSLRPFFSGLFDPLTEGEKEIVHLLRDRGDDFYVIATFKGGDDEVYEHEMCHALYGTNEEYRNSVNDAMHLHQVALKELVEKMKEMGYSVDVIWDECHAYMCASSEWLIKEGVPYPVELAKSLREIKEKFTT